MAPGVSFAGSPKAVGVFPENIHTYSQIEVLFSERARLAPKKKAEIFLSGSILRSDGKTSPLSVKLPAFINRARRVLHNVDETLLDALGGAHGEFEGELTVVTPFTDGTMNTQVIKGVKLNLFPSQIQNLVAAGAASTPFENSSIPGWVWQILAYFVCACVILLGFFAPFAGIISYVERRIAGRIQSRIGPNRVGPAGFLQWLADGLKALQKEDFIPPQSEQLLFRVSPYFVMAGVFLTFVHIPFSQSLIVADFDVGMFYILAVTSVVVVGIILGGWASNNKWSMLGGFRSAAQMISYEIPLGLSVLTVATLAGSLSLQKMVGIQGALPWEWTIFHNPGMTAAFFFFFISALAEGNRAPFDLPEAESELVSGYNTEYSGMRFVFFFFAEWGNLYVMSSLASLMFLGGWLIPGITPLAMEASPVLQILGFGALMVKSLALVFVIIWIRWTLPRLRVDQMMSMCWKYLIPLSFASFLCTAAWMVFVPEVAQTIVRYLLFGSSFVILSLFIARVRYNLRAAIVEGSNFSGKLHY